MLITTSRLRKLGQNKRGLSSIIVVVLSLVIIVTIVSNVFLWNYQMSELDWERTKESIKILGATRITDSSWFVAESEYNVSSGSLQKGSYSDTQTINAVYETFYEDLSSLQEIVRPNAVGQYSQWPAEFPSGMVHWTACAEASPDDDGSYIENNAATFKKDAYNLQDPIATGNINWVRVYVRARLVSVGAGSIRTLIRTYNADYESNDINLTTSYQDLCTQYNTNPYTGARWTWTEIDSLQAGASSQKTEAPNIRTTTVWVVVDHSIANVNQLDINGIFAIDVSTYTIEYIQTVEIQLLYRASDVEEKWYISSYNWTSATYSDAGFNSTSGHTATAGWDYYAVNITDKWRSYVANNGSICVRFQDSQADADQTIIDVDFLGVRIKINGTLISLGNEGSLTSRIVSLWIINSTIHQRYNTDIIINSAETFAYIRADTILPEDAYTVKVVTERGNVAVYVRA